LVFATNATFIRATIWWKRAMMMKCTGKGRQHNKDKFIETRKRVKKRQCLIIIHQSELRKLIYSLIQEYADGQKNDDVKRMRSR
jgi:hypothetical protein